jgi:hypothetical protein
MAENWTMMLIPRSYFPNASRSETGAERALRSEAWVERVAVGDLRRARRGRRPAPSAGGHSGACTVIWGSCFPRLERIA